MPTQPPHATELDSKTLLSTVYSRTLHDQWLRNSATLIMPKSEKLWCESSVSPKLKVLKTAILSKIWCQFHNPLL